MRRTILLLSTMAVGLLLASGAAMALEQAEDATPAKTTSAAGANITKEFGNGAQIVIPLQGQASPYPSEIEG